MNDPELDAPIQDSAREIDEELEGDISRSSSHVSSDSFSPSRHNQSSAFRQELRRADEHDKDHPEGFYQAKRWWFTSTAFPLIAGTFGPISNLFSACALAQTWRVEFQLNDEGSETKGKRVADPDWLIAVNVVSLAFALAANVLLSLNFAQRVRYRVAAPLTVVFWYIACFMLVALVIAANKALILEPREQHAFSQSYYYGIISAVIYFIISTMLLWNLLGATRFKRYPQSFTSLTVPQRTLMLQTISYSCYLAMGAGIFAGIEGWEYVDGIYFADYTLLTIAFGTDYPLNTALARALVMPYAVVGIIMLGLVIGSIRSLFLERGKMKVKGRTLHKKRMKIEEQDEKEKRKRSMKQEFEVMRELQETSAKERKWWGFAWSLGAFVLLWLGGAGVFTATERTQNWNYFDSLYFAFTTLITIGFGDYYPQSNSGKPFFVLWSLIAVPTVTILISTMGDTVVGWVKEGTLWLGQKTILPERKSRGHRMKSPKKVERELKEEQTREENESITDVEDSPSRPDEDLEKGRHPDGNAKSKSNRQDADPSVGGGVSRLGSAVGHSERERANKAERDNKYAEASRHDLASRIAGEISSLSMEISHKPAKQYSWEEWKRFLNLLGHEDKETSEWRWLSDHGPLLSGVSETEWILGKLCERLQELLEEGVRRGDEGGEKKKEE